MGIQPQRYNEERINFAQIHAPLKTFFLATTAGTGSTSSGAFSDYPGPIEKVIVKRETATSLFVAGFVGAFKGTNGGNITIGLRINGVDYVVGRQFFNQLNTHMAIPTNQTFGGTNLPAGTYTVRIRWATGNVSAEANPDDVIHLRFEEGYFG